MKSRFFKKILAAVSAMAMATAMMVTSASAEYIPTSGTWNVYRQNRGNGTYSTNGLYSGFIQTGAAEPGKTRCRVSCTSFYTERPYDKPAPHVMYYAYVSKDPEGDVFIGFGFGYDEYYNTSGYVYKNLDTPVVYGQYLQFYFRLIDYQNVKNCNITGKYTW